MSKLRLKIATVAVLCLTLAGTLGVSAGLVTAGTRSQPLLPGPNLLGGPLQDSVPPGDFLACLPATSWKAVYLYVAETQTWRHYFNPSLSMPSYVNKADFGGISVIPQAAGLWIIMQERVDNPFVKDRASATCP